MNRYFPIDCAKIIMAVMIVALHSMPLFYNADINQYTAWSLDLIVPLFFCFSGFFFAKKTDLKKSLKHLVPLYLFYAILSWPLSFIVFKGLSVWQVVHKIIFFGTFNIGWFIIALIWCMIIVTAIDQIRDKKIRYVILILVSVISYFICLSFISYHSIFSTEIIGRVQKFSEILLPVPQWSFMRGILFFVIGFLFSRLELHIDKRTALLILFIALTAYFSELTLSNNNGLYVTSINFSIPLVVFAVMSVFLCYCKPTEDHGLGKKFRQISTMLYLSHPMIMFLLYRTCDITGGWMRLISTLLVFTVGYTIYQWLRQQPRFQWLRYAC